MFQTTLTITQLGLFVSFGHVYYIKLPLRMQMQVWFIPLADERGVCR